MDKKLFQGAGGPDAPTTTSDNLKTEDIVEFALAVSEGPIRGLTKGAKSFMVGDTQLVNEAGARNFDKFAIGVHPGYPEGVAQPLDLKLGGVTSTTQVGINLVQGVAVVRQALSALRGTIDEIEVRIQINRLVRIEDDGSTFNNTARFTIEYKKSQATTWNSMFGSFDSSGEITGKTTSGSVAEFRVSVPRIEDDDWDIRVTKISVDNDPHDVVDLSWESFQCTNKTKLTYPDTAIVHGLGVANGQFSSIPEFSGVYDGLMIRIPSNYNPDLHTYDDSVPWDGSFKFGWTENPAWILYDLITNTRYGLAKHRRYIDANRFTFYEAARWCDERVAVGDTLVTRPRFTYNDVITDARSGLEMLGYVAGSFNALVWDDLQGQIHLRVDKDDPAVQVFTPESVTEDGFSYTFTDITTRANDISVSFINPELDWVEDRRRISGITTNEENIEKFGRIPLDFIAVGCTNVHEAVAKAQVRLLSALTETTMVTFTTARQGAFLSMYDVILVADPVMGWATTGRMTSYDANYVNFRDAIFIETMKPYVLKIQTQNGIIEVQVTPDEIGHVNRLRLTGGSTLPNNLPRYAVFILEETEGFGLGKPFRVMTIEEVDGSPYVYQITAVEINRNKYLLSETATPITEPTYSYQQPFVPGVPRNLKATSGDDQILILPSGELINRILVSWTKPTNSLVTGYELQWKGINDETWQVIPTNLTQQYLTPVVPGQHYTMRVASFDPQGNRSAWNTIADYLVIGKSNKPLKLESLSAKGGLFQIELTWKFSGRTDISKVELWVATSNFFPGAVRLVDVAYPSTEYVHQGIDKNRELFYWARVIDTSGNESEFVGPSNATPIVEAKLVLDILEGQIKELQLFEDLRTRIGVGGTIDKAIADLVITYGDTVAAAQSAVEAAAAAVAATQAKADAIFAAADAAEKASQAASSKVAAESANTAAGTAAAASVEAKQLAQSAATNAASSASAANTAKIAAESANTAAGLKADAAVTAAQQASSFSTQAGTSAAASAQSAVQAAASATDAGSAGNSAAAAVQSAQQAAASATAASQSANSASSSSTTAGTLAGQASTSAAAASQARTDAAGSATQASQSATIAAQAANGVSGSVTAAAGSASTAATKADAASQSATAAQTARVAAETARDSIGNSVSAAATSASQAAASKTAAQEIASSITSQVNSAATSAGQAYTYMVNAANSGQYAADQASVSAQNYSVISARLNNLRGIGLEQVANVLASQVDGLSAQYSVKIDNNGWVAGFGLSSQPVNGGIVSAFIVSADRFAIVSPGFAPRVMFSVSQINGATAIGLNGNVVIDGSIQTAGIAQDGLSGLDYTGGGGGSYYFAIPKPAKVLISCTMYIQEGVQDGVNIYFNGQLIFQTTAYAGGAPSGIPIFNLGIGTLQVSSRGAAVGNISVLKVYR